MTYTLCLLWFFPSTEYTADNFHCYTKVIELCRTIIVKLSLATIKTANKQIFCAKMVYSLMGSCSQCEYEAKNIIKSLRSARACVLIALGIISNWLNKSKMSHKISDSVWFYELWTWSMIWTALIWLFHYNFTVLSVLFWSVCQCLFLFAHLPPVTITTKKKYPKLNFQHSKIVCWFCF